MAEFRVEGLDATMIAATLDQRDRIFKQYNAAVEKRMRELYEELPKAFNIRIEGGAVVAFWDDSPTEEQSGE